MREILFRGKRVDNGEWVDGFLLHKYFCEIPHDRIVIQYRPEIGSYKWIPDYMVAEVDPATIGQYTGLTDKNGKKIFEGDIVRMNGNPLDLAVIRFGEFACVDIELEEKTDRVHGWYFKPIETDGLSRLEPFCWEFQLNEMWIKENEVEVIGNIHDNPELLKGDNDAEIR